LPVRGTDSTRATRARRHPSLPVTKRSPACGAALPNRTHSTRWAWGQPVRAHAGRP